jgi:hypothetical protein
LASQSSTIVFALCPFVLSGADEEAGAAVVEFGVPVSASALLCRIAIPASAPQTQQRCFFTFRLLLAFLCIPKSSSKRVAAPATIPSQTNSNFSGLFPRQLSIIEFS